MQEEAFDFELDRVLREIDERGCEEVSLQFPQGLKRQATDVVDRLRERAPDVRFYVSGEPCYGACDLDEWLLKRTDVLVHFGHSPIRDSDSVIYVESRSTAPVEGVVRRAAEELDAGEPVCLTTTAQHGHAFDEARDILESEGFTVVTQGGDDRLDKEGQVLGCNYTSVVSDAPQVLYLGNGDFHPVGLAMDHPDKHLVVADPMNDEIREVDGERFVRQRYGEIARARQVEPDRWGVILCTKIGQRRERLAYDLVESYDDTYLVTMNEVTPDRLLHFDADAYVNTACPRITTDDGPRYDAPMLTPVEFEIAIGERDWDELDFDTFHGAW
ncbi:MAG: diphthamide biosynthesis enzyme Dph2 [Halobacteriales archaeon]